MNDRQDKKSILTTLSVLFIAACSSGGFQFSITNRNSDNPAVSSEEVDTSATVDQFDDLDEIDDNNPFDPSSPTFDPDDPPLDPTTQDPTGSSVVDKWNQPNEFDNLRPVDIIFTVDSSGSLDAERAALTDALQGFLSTLEGRGVTDYCVGVLVGHVGAQSGLLQSGSGVTDGRKCLCSADYSDAAALRDDFGRILDNPSEEGASDGGEALFYSYHQSFSDATKLAANQAAGCYRDTSALVSAFLSDENEISTSREQNSQCGQSFSFSPAGPASVADDQCNEPEVRQQFYSDSSGNLILGEKDIYDASRSFQGVLPFVPAAVGYVDTNNIPLGGENEYFYGGVELANRGGGFLVDLADATAGNQSAFNDAWNNLGNLLAVNIQLLTTFDLSQKPCPTSVKVEVDGSSVPFTLNSQRVAISVADAGSFGSLVEISYSVCN